MDLSNQLNENYGTFSNHHLLGCMLDKYETVSLCASGRGEMMAKETK